MTLLLASRGHGESDGIYGIDRHDGRYRLTGPLVRLAGVAATAWHVRLPLLYAVTNEPDELVLLAPVAGGLQVLSRVAIPEGACHLAVDPAGDRVVTVHYEPGGICRLMLDGRGVPRIGRVWNTWPGRGPDPGRQRQCHPHSATYDSGQLTVADLGTDSIWIESGSAATDSASEWTRVHVAAGSGPRHQAVLDSSRVLVTGELDSSLLTIDLDEASWTTQSSTGRHLSPSVRNYPGDLVYDPRRRVAVVANRGFDSLAVFRIEDASSRLVEEVRTGAWPQHLLIDDDRILVACERESMLEVYAWGDSDALRLVQRLPAPGPAWLLASSAV